jgi:hypothetical protein
MAEELEEYGEQGKVVAVYVVPTGDELELDAVLGQTVLQLSDVADFSEVGGQVQINETVYPYMEIDDELNTLTLATGLVEDVPVDTKVFLYPLSNEKWAMVQVVDIEEPVDARIPHQLTDLFEEGIKDLGAQDSVAMVLEGSDWVIRDVIGKEPSIDGSYIRPETLPSPDQTDGLPPQTAPVVMVRPLGWSGMTITWNPVPNPDPVTYKVLFDSVNPPVQELTDTMGTITSTSVLKDGTSLNPDTVYYAQVIPYDADGPGPASAVMGGSPIRVPVDAVVEDILVVNDLYTRQGYFGRVSADQIETGDFTATLAVIAGGLALGGDMESAGITMTPERIEVVHNDGSGGEPRRTSTLAASGISLRAEATLLSAVIDKMVVRGVDSEIATGAEVTVQAGTTSPKQAPTISYEYKQRTIHGGYYPRGLVRFLAWASDIYLQTESMLSGTITTLVRNANDDFVWGGQFIMNTDGGRSEITQCGGITVIGSDVYTICQTNEDRPGSYDPRWYIYKWSFNGAAAPDTSKFSYVTRWLYESSAYGIGSYSDWFPALGTDGTNVLVVQSNSNNNWRIHKYSPTGTDLGSTALYQSNGTTQFNTARHAGGLVYGAFDGAGTRFYVATESYAHTYSFYTNGTRDDLLTPFWAPETPMKGLAHDGTRFIHRGTNKAFYYSRIIDVTGVKGVQTWRKHDATDAITPTVGDKAEFETSASPEASPSLRLRAYIRIQSPSDIPTSGGADALSFYLKRTSDSPAGFRIVSPPDPGVQSVLLDTWPTTQIAPPAVTTFGAATPGIIKSAGQKLPAYGTGPTWKLTGNGPGNMGPWIWDADGKSLSGPQPGDTETEITGTFGTGWGQGSKTPYFVTLNGVIFLNGYLKRTSGTVTNPILTLPGAARPRRSIVTFARSSNQWIPFVINVSGTVVVSSAYVTNEDLSLDNISYPAAA